MKERYPELLRMLAEDIIQDKFKKHITDKLPDGVDDILDGAMKNIFDQQFARCLICARTLIIADPKLDEIHI
ncbi:unnamed protein product [Rotaria socialis]|uniref:Uncharacterized protein n=1 Tax=Rotaria socialis TaxID=392032 RepID=A0A820XTW5_9BILA|nr:unnamed protein product [Rotaria socialis]